MSCSAACIRSWRRRAGRGRLRLDPQIYGGADVLDELGAEEGSGATGHQALQHRDLPLRRRRRAAGQGRARRDRVPFAACAPSRSRRPIVVPALFRRREFREGSGGAGNSRGGLGQIIELGGADGNQLRCCAISSGSGTRRAAATAAGRARPAVLPWVRASRSAQGPAERAGRRFHPARTAGGRRLWATNGARSRAGRPRCRRRADLARGAQRDYRVALTDEGGVDRSATARLRAA